jgi:glycosyltransferase involved in cell wall biosynthesis
MKDKKNQILHLTPHLGTGVGAVVLNYLTKVKASEEFEHSIVCLDYANDLAKATAAKVGFALRGDMSQEPETLLKMIEAADIVLVHWWNHPLLYDFLVRHPWPASRVIFWSHITGSPAPNNFTPKALQYPDRFVFTTPLSFNVKEVKVLVDRMPNHFSAIWSTGGVERLQWIKPQAHQGFNVGYVGSLDPAKIHPDFLDICSRIKIPDVHFIVVGGPNDKSLELAAAADRRGLGDKFTFTGFISEEEKWNYLSLFDVFGYPLAPHHYGSSDQTLQENMGVGAVPVVLNNPMESLMVKNGDCGFVAGNISEYVEAVTNLYRDKNLRNRLSQNAKQYALDNYSLVKMEQQWNELFTQLLSWSKTARQWPLDKDTEAIDAKDIFMESLGEYGRPFADYCQAADEPAKQAAVAGIRDLAKSANWRSATKSTVHQYYTFFPNDKHLAAWSSLMK